MLKRFSDIACSAVALVVLVPVYLVIGAMVWSASKGPVFFAQERVGRQGKKFHMYKFRTMHTDAEVDGPALSSLDDPRITPVGRVLRKYRLDELPQFWNVLIGDMSLVGPRPEREYYEQQIIEKAPQYADLHQLRPGLTSLGMVKYGYASTVDQMIERMRWDLEYLHKRSMLLDLKILFLSVSTVITGKGI